MPLFSRKPDLPPATPTAPEPNPNDFIYRSILSQLAHLRDVNYIKEATFDDVTAALDRDRNGTDEDKLGPKNRMLREWLIEEEIIPELITQVVGIIAPGGLGFLQEEAISALASKYAPHIAHAVTNPILQEKVTQVSAEAAKTAQVAVAQGYKASLQAMERKTQAQQLAEASHRARMDETLQSVAPRKRWTLDATTEEVDAFTKVHTTAFSPADGVWVTSAVVNSTEPDAGAVESVPLVSSVAPPPPPRGTGSRHVDKFDPPVPPRRVNG